MTGELQSHTATTPLRFDGVRHSYGDVPTLRGVDLDARPGEVLCLVGPSGCGKTTMLRVAAGLEQPSDGAVWIDDVQVAGDGVNIPPERRKVGLIFQDFALFPHLSVTENVAFGLRVGSTADKRARARDMLRLVELEDFADRNPSALSGGQQQRVAVARALAPAPAAMLLDEPFANLDASLRRQVRDDALGLLRRNGAPALFVTHDAEEAMLCADRIAVMRDGEVLQIGRPDEIYFQPNCAFVARFFGSMNRFVRIVRGGVVQTPLGETPAPGFADGDEVEVLVRPEAIKLAAGGDGPAGAVSATRFAGETRLITVDIADNDGSGDCCLECRVFGYEHVARGDHVRVDVDRNRVFVFPLDRACSRLAA